MARSHGQKLAERLGQPVLIHSLYADAARQAQARLQDLMDELDAGRLA